LQIFSIMGQRIELKFSIPTFTPSARKTLVSCLFTFTVFYRSVLRNV